MQQFGKSVGVGRPAVGVGDRHREFEVSLEVPLATRGRTVDEIDERGETYEVDMGVGHRPELLQPRADGGVQRGSLSDRAPEEVLASQLLKLARTGPEQQAVAAHPSDLRTVRAEPSAS